MVSPGLQVLGGTADAELVNDDAPHLMCWWNTPRYVSRSNFLDSAKISRTHLLASCDVNDLACALHTQPDRKMSERPSKKARLLDDSDSEDGGVALTNGHTVGELKVNEEYAKRFEHNKKREEKHRCTSSCNSSEMTLTN